MKRVITQSSKYSSPLKNDKFNNARSCVVEKYAIWIGPHFESKGGVASVINIFKTEGFFETGQNRFIATMEDGSKLHKLFVFIRAFILFAQEIGKAKLVHVHLSGKASFWRKSVFMLTSNLFGIPVVTHLHDSGFPIFYASVSKFQKWFIRKVLSNSNRLFVLSTEIQEFVKKISPGADPAIFPNPVILKTSAAPANRAEHEILFLGRIIKDKGIQELLKAIAIVKKTIPSVHLLIGGDGDMNFLYKLIGDLNLQHNVTIKGWVRDCEREALMQTSTVLVLPSYAEGQSMSILEAMEAYLPVISTSVGGNTFLIDSGTSGFLVPPRDARALAAAIQLLLEDHSLRSDLVQAARQRIEELFDSRKVISKVEELYNKY